MLLLLFLGGLLLFVTRGGSEGAGWADWQASLRTQAARSPASRGLTPLLEAFDRTDWEALEDHRESLLAAATSSDLPPAEIAGLLRAHQPAISAVARFAAFPQAQLPTLEGMGLDAPRPDLPRLELFCALLAANTRSLGASGQPVEAAQRAVELALLGARLSAPQPRATLSHHLAGARALEFALGALRGLEPGRVLRPDQKERLRDQLLAIRAQRAPISAGILGELARYSEAIERAGEDPVALSAILMAVDPELGAADARQRARDWQGDALSIGPAFDLYAERLRRDLARPFAGQPDFNRRWREQATENRLLRHYQLDINGVLRHQREIDRGFEGVLGALE